MTPRCGQERLRPLAARRYDRRDDALAKGGG
jgi:hypothetical protein